MTGYESKRAAARDKLEDDDTLTIAYQSGYYDGKKTAQPAQEPVAWCSQCGHKCPLPAQEPATKPYRVKKRFTISLMEKLIEAKLKETKRR
jgi:hypothetical protein